jgi:hypothetical protein
MADPVVLERFEARADPGPKADVGPVQVRLRSHDDAQPVAQSLDSMQ